PSPRASFSVSCITSCSALAGRTGSANAASTCAVSSDQPYHVKNQKKYGRTTKRTTASATSMINRCGVPRAGRNLDSNLARNRLGSLCGLSELEMTAIQTNDRTADGQTVAGSQAVPAV